jgi:hypothetical protein
MMALGLITFSTLVIQNILTLSVPLTLADLNGKVSLIIDPSGRTTVLTPPRQSYRYALSDYVLGLNYPLATNAS